MPDQPPKRPLRRTDAVLNDTVSDADEPAIGARKKPALKPQDKLLNETASDADEPPVGAKRTPREEPASAAPPDDDDDDDPTMKTAQHPAYRPAPAQKPVEEFAEAKPTGKLPAYRPPDEGLEESERQKTARFKPAPAEPDAIPPPQEQRKTGRFATGPAIKQTITDRTQDATREVSRDEADTPLPMPREQPPPPEASPEATARFQAPPSPPPPARPEEAEPEEKRTARFTPVPPSTAVAPAAEEEDAKRTARFVPLAMPPAPPAAEQEQEQAKKTARFVPHTPLPEPPSIEQTDAGQKTARFVAPAPPPEPPPEPLPPNPLIEQTGAGQKTARFVPHTEPAPPAAEDAESGQRTARFNVEQAGGEDAGKKTARINLNELSEADRGKISKAREEYLHAVAKKLEERRQKMARAAEDEEDAPGEGSTAFVRPSKPITSSPQLRDAASMIEPAGPEVPPSFVSESPLPGEADDEPLDKPHRLTRETEGDTVDIVEADSPKPRRKLNATAVWVAAGTCLGAALGLSLFFAAGVSLPFLNSRPKLAYTFDPLAFLSPEDAAEAWVKRGPIYLSPGEASIYVFDGAHERLLGAVEIADPGAMPAEAAPIGFTGGLEFQDLTLAWQAGATLRWKRMDFKAQSAESGEPLVAAPVGGRSDLPSNGAIPFAPTKIEDWASLKTESLLVAVRERDTKLDSLRVVDAAGGQEGEALELKARLLAPPIAFYDPEAKASYALIVAGTAADARAQLLKIVGTTIQPVPDAEAALPWPVSGAARVARARFGGQRGWVIAQKDACAAVAFLPNGMLQLKGLAGKPKPSEDQAAPPPVVVTFPNTDAPGYDRALIVDAASEKENVPALLASFGPAGAADPVALTVPAACDGMAACDLDADGCYDVIALNKKTEIGRVWLMDGRRWTVSQVEPAQAATAPLPVISQIRWTLQPPAAPAGSSAPQGRLGAFYFSKGGQAVKALFEVKGDGWNWLQADFRWRSADEPFLGGPRP